MHVVIELANSYLIIVSFSELTKQRTKILTRENLEDLVRGSTVLASGGGGEPKEAFKLIGRIEKKGFVPSIMDPQSIQDSMTVFSSVDAGGGMSKESEERFERTYKMKIPLRRKHWPLEKWSPVAVKELSEYLNKEPDVFLCLELGPRFVEVIHLAASNGKPTIDGDTIGRAVPEITMSKLQIVNSKLEAVVSTSHFGDVLILKKLASLRRLEDIIRNFAVASGGGVGMAVAMNGAVTKESLLPCTLTRCINLGEKVRKSASDDRELNKLLSCEVNGRVLFRGRITSIESEPREGYYFGQYFMGGSGDFSGDNFRIWFKNENHITWKNDKPYVTSPDIITLFDPVSRLGLWNWEKIPTDHDLLVIGIPCDPMWRTMKGLQLLSPRAFGYSIDYVPLERQHH